MSVVETVRVEEWLYQTLAGDPTLRALVGDRVYAYQAPHEARYPLVVFSRQAGRDVRGVGPSRILANEIYQVKVIGRGSAVGFAALKAIADRVDTLLQGSSGAVADGQVLSCVRESAVSYVETEEGAVYCHLGGLYRIQVMAS